MNLDSYRTCLTWICTWVAKCDDKFDPTIYPEALVGPRLELLGKRQDLSVRHCKNQGLQAGSGLSCRSGSEDFSDIASLRFKNLDCR